ncbi:glutamyl-tRNA reductase [Pontibacter akesuensis]|uniref:Glutamyl-tRNA reductase n=2 Tax=Pontibacter akesuensis TaxID=388950 RepID=A0A1I7GEL3_9BACT|nr:glutamyl-tRNA reductase [Pontibacter akesuensis]SFU46899.1 glutamyl-tRNA reductase [Pontibacter akesuensis]
MQNHFKALTLSYKNAPIVIREEVALNEIACRNLLDKIREFTEAQDVLVLSTCNRTEVYYSSPKDLSREIVKLLAIEKGFVATKRIMPHFRHITAHQEAVQHLFQVALGLESQVVGDMQILNQVKKSYQWASDAGMAGPFLHRLMHTIFFANKRVANETAFRDGAASVSYATVELVEELTDHLLNPRVLMIGVGEIGANVCDNFRKSSIENLTIVNRTHHKALELAQKCNARVAYWENVWEEIKLADVVISSVPGDCFFISKAEFEQCGPQAPTFFIDLSMPRSIDSDLAALKGTSVHNVDSIRNRTTQALELRLAAIPAVQYIIADAIAEFSNWTREMTMSPALQQFKNRLEEVREQEIARYLKKLSTEEKALVETITKNMLNKIVRMPAMRLKAACMRGESDALLEGLSSLFDLEKEEFPAADVRI